MEADESQKPTTNVHDFSEDEDAPLNDDNLAELREEQVCFCFSFVCLF